MTYNFTLSDGGSLVDVLALESNGYASRSVPKQVLDVLFSTTNAFVISDDMTSRFIAGFVFDVIDGPFIGAYTVAIGGSTYDSILNRTTIPITTFIVSSPLGIVDVTAGLNGVWTVSGAANGDCVYYPGSSFTVAGNTEPLANTVYTVQSVAVSGSYPIFAVVSGPGGVGTTWTFIGSIVDFFNVGEQFKITGSNPGVGTYTIVSAVPAGANTEVTVVESIPGTANINGLGTPFPAVTRITVTGTILGAPTASGTATVPPSVAYSFVSPPTMLTPLGPVTWSLIWHLGPATATDFVVGCPIQIRDNNIFPHAAMTITAAVQNGANVDLTASFQYATTPVLPNAPPGSLVHPLPPIPYGFIQYDGLPAASSLELVGRGSAAFNNVKTWGEALQDNDIHILENFANTTPPVAPLQGQLWFNQGSSSLFLFTSTIYNITAVVPGTGVWTIGPGNFTAVFTVGQKFAIFGNKGIDDNGSFAPTLVFQVLSSAFVGADTEITIDITPTLTPPFVAVQTAIPAVADDDIPYGSLYAMTDWHEIAFSEDIFTMDPKQSVRVTTTAALTTPYIYDNGVDGVGATITATVNGDINLEASVEAPTIPPLVVDDRVLIKNETAGNAPYNGIYTITQVGSGGSPYILTRATDADTGNIGGKVSAGMYLFVEEGLVFMDTGWLLITDNPITLGTTSLNFQIYAPPAEPPNQVVYGTGTGIDSDADFSYINTTGALYVNTTNGTTGSVSVTAPGVVGLFGASASAAATAGGNVTVLAGTGNTTGSGGNITITSGAGGATGAGADLRLRGGNGGGTSGDAGDVHIRGGFPTDGVGGEVSISGTDGAGTNRAGGDIVIVTGNATGTAAAGDFTVTAGQSVTGAAGTVTITGGAGGSTSGNGGLVTVVGGTPTSGVGGAVTVQAAAGVGLNQAGGIASLIGGAATGTGTGGNVNITAGASPTGTDGIVTLTGGNGDVLQVGASINLTGFDSTTGSPININAGDSSAAAGGAVVITAGAATAGANTGGAVSISSGAGLGGGAGGDVTIAAAVGAGAGADGDIVLDVGGGGGFVWRLDGDTGKLLAGTGTTPYAFGSATTTGMGLAAISSGVGLYATGQIKLDINTKWVSTQGIGNFSTSGDSCSKEYVLRSQTTNATTTELFIDGTLGTSRMNLNNDTTWHFEVKLAARRTDADNEGLAFESKGAIDRNVGAATTALIGATTDTTLADDNAGAWVVLVDADAVNGSLRIQVTGQVGKTIRWVAFVRTVEVTG